MDTDNFFCVFWFPTIFHCEKKNRCKGDQLGPYDIDDASLDPLKLTITRQESNNPDLNGAFDLIFKLSGEKDEENKEQGEDDKKKKEFKIRFTCVEQSRNGFVSYSYNREQLLNTYYSVIATTSVRSESKDDQIIDALFISFYHYAKLFYHEHESDSECDGRYAAYYYTQETEEGPRKYLKVQPFLSTHNNPVINWYLDQFEKQIISNAENISQKLRDWTPLIEAYTKTPTDVKDADDGNDEEKIEKTVRSIQVQLYYRQQPKGFPQDIKSIEKKKRFLKDLYQSNLSIITNHRNDEGAKSSLSSNVQKALEGNDENEIEEIVKSIQKLLNEQQRPKGIPPEIKSIEGKKRFLKDLYQSKLSIITKHRNDELAMFLLLCNNSLIEYTYCKTLLESKYNDNYKHDSKISAVEPQKDEKDRCRKKAFNIRNSIRYIESAKRKCEIWQNNITETLLDEIHNLSSQVTKQVDENTTLTGEVRTQTEEVGKLVTKNTTLTEKVSEQTGKVNELLGKNTALTEKVSEQTGKVNELVGKNTTLTEKVSEQTGKVNGLLDNNTKLTEKVSEQTGKVHDLLDKVKVQTDKVRELSEESKKSNKKSTGLGWLSFGLGIISVALGFYSVYLARKGGEPQQESHQCDPQSTEEAIADTTINTTTVTFDTPFVDIPNNMVKEKGDTTTDKKSNNR